jgi:hypothetical protein
MSLEMDLLQFLWKLFPQPCVLEAVSDHACVNGGLTTFGIVTLRPCTSVLLLLILPAAFPTSTCIKLCQLLVCHRSQIQYCVAFFHTLSSGTVLASATLLRHNDLCSPFCTFILLLLFTNDARNMSLVESNFKLLSINMCSFYIIPLSFFLSSFHVMNHWEWSLIPVPNDSKGE